MSYTGEFQVFEDIIKEKKKGVKCIGCPFAENCAKRNQTSKCSSHK